MTVIAPRAGTPGRPRHIVLVGASGAGKSTVAPVLAAHLGVRCEDTDAAIATTIGEPGGDFIARYGIVAFRGLEERVVAAVLNKHEPHVIATGAGAWTVAAIRAWCLNTGTAVWMRVSENILVKRVTNSDRYITRVREPALVIAEQLKERTQFYETADVIVDCDALSVDDVATTIAVAVQEALRSRVRTPE